MPSTLIIRHRHSAFVAQAGRCYYCDTQMWENDVESFSRTRHLTLKQARLVQCTAEHLIPREDGGTDFADNIVAACKYCNQHRHKRKSPPSPSAYRQLIKQRLRIGKWHKVRPVAGRILPSTGRLSSLPQGASL